MKQDANAKAPPRDENIQHRIVQLVDPETGRLTEPTPLRTILAGLDRRTKYVELVSVTPAPIVKVFDKLAESQRSAEAQYKARAAARKAIQKEVQLTWNAAPGDLAHKLEKMRQELERGARVDLVFARKKNQAYLPLEEMQARAQDIVDSLADVAKEWKDREVRAGMTAIFLQGTGEPTTEVSRKKLVVHKGPKPKKQKLGDGGTQDLYQD
ncbi:putative ribosome disassembly concerning protein [Lyophyllum shimeji]|uniref:Ribosome disassembly concerning protein n=1 Tax=Lyophyllum shimeji TaxID=47721 RepID=A0A9P3UHN4_LYOSH|nr:putative ribosome disassembly concerning protein [Lyophyllum shimeji]